MSLIEWVELIKHRSDSGSLVAVEAEVDVPFEIRRVYYLYELEREHHRGFHAHKQLQQLAVCVHGSCRFLLDNGSQRQEVRLDEPHKGLLIRSMVWREMFDFSLDCVLMVLASQPFEEADYIRDYKAFIDAASK